MLRGVLDIFNKDSDTLLAYQTKQQVAVRDRWLGFLEKFLQLSVVAYIVIVVFIFGQGHLEFENSRGSTVLHVAGSAVATSTGNMKKQFFATEDIFETLENGNTFVLTKVDVEEQKRGVCEDATKPCVTAEDCSKNVGAVCSENQYCLEPSWCADEPSQTFKPMTKFMRIWVKSAITFTGYRGGETFYNNMDAPILYPAAGFNTLTVENLLLLCDPPVRFEEISELGAAIEVQIRWFCMIGSIFGCRDKMFARRVDPLFDEEEIGFNYKRSLDAGDGIRHSQKRHGIRFYFKTVGIGAKMSTAATIFRISTGLALLGFVPVITDFVMLNMFKLKKKYFARKYEVTEDFSDHFDARERAWADEFSMALPWEVDDAELEELQKERDHELEDDKWKKEMEEEEI